jgi:hypothetical protein
VRYEIRFAQCVCDHMTFLTVAERSTLLEAIREQLAHEPLVETRKRKPLRPNPLAPWELRVGPLRAFYDVRPPDPKRETLADVVYVLAVGKKERNVLRIAGEIVKI